MLATWAADLWEFLLPPGCVSCRRWIPPADRETATLVCVSCRARMRRGAWPRCTRCHWPKGTGRSDAPTCRECAEWPPELVAARFAYLLQPPVDDLVHGLKYEGWRELADFMGTAMATGELPSGSAARPAAVVPVPTTPERIRTRGYNQAELLAKRLAAVRGLPLVHALRRPSSVGSQTSLGRSERLRNVSGSFLPKPEAETLRDRVVWLVDDVLTTGATVSAATEALVASGVAGVAVLTFARAPAGRGHMVA